ncbi:MAG: cyclase family protein [Actinobacteria bacterium]|nr:cyclase family protein [Actinomycetota bacterium]
MEHESPDEGVEKMCLPGTIETVRATVKDEGPTRISRRTALLAGAGTAAAGVLPRPALASPAAEKRTQDLTHVFREGFPVYSFDPPARRTLVTVEQDGFYSQEWTFGEHSGTHMDAPGHFIAGGRYSPEITLDELFVPVAVIDISDRVAHNSDAVVTPSDLMRFERRYGRIPKRAGVFMYSGWERRVGNPDAFKNVGSDGKFHFPGFGVRAVEWLLAHRHITCIGVDTLSLDRGASTTFATHLTILGANKYGLENIANLKRIPPIGARAFVGLIPWEEGSGGPCRLIARW